MFCPDCQDSDTPCLACDGYGHICDICGEPAAERGAAYCEPCLHDKLRSKEALPQAGA